MDGQKSFLNEPVEREAFLEQLYRFHDKLGTPIRRIPTLGGRELDLCHLFNKVQSLGGSKVVSDSRLWGEVARSFNLPPSVTSASYAIRQHYGRLLEKFEYYQLDPIAYDPFRPTVITPTNKWLPWSPPVPSPQPQITTLTATEGGDQSSQLSRLVRSLLSGYPNEVDFSLNVLTILSHSPGGMAIQHMPHLLALLLAHVGIFSDDDPWLMEVHHETWYKGTQTDFMQFWELTVPEWVFVPLCEQTFRNACYMRSLFSPHSLPTEECVETHRVTQVIHILRNISFDEQTAKHLARNESVHKFLLLGSNCCLPSIKSLALDTVANLAPYTTLTSSTPHTVTSSTPHTSPLKFHPAVSPHTLHTSQPHSPNKLPSPRKRPHCYQPPNWTDLLLGTLCECIQSQDRNQVLRGIEMFGELSWHPSNMPHLLTTPTNVYQRIFKLLLLPDAILLLSCLDALYNLTFSSREMSRNILSVEKSSHILISLLMVETDSLGSEIMNKVKVFETSVANPHQKQNKPAVSKSGSITQIGNGTLKNVKIGNWNSIQTLKLPSKSQGQASSSPLTKSHTSSGQSFIPVLTVQQLQELLSKSASSAHKTTPLNNVTVNVLSGSKGAGVKGQSSKATVTTAQGSKVSVSLLSPMTAVSGVGEKDSQQFAKNWLTSQYEESSGCYVSPLEMYSGYLRTCTDLKGQVKIITMADFNTLIKKVFPNSLSTKISLSGSTVYMVAGLSKKTTPTSGTQKTVTVVTSVPSTAPTTPIATVLKSAKTGLTTLTPSVIPKPFTAAKVLNLTTPTIKSGVQRSDSRPASPLTVARRALELPVSEVKGQNLMAGNKEHVEVGVRSQVDTTSTEVKSCSETIQQVISISEVKSQSESMLDVKGLIRPTAEMNHISSESSLPPAKRARSLPPVEVCSGCKDIDGSKQYLTMGDGSDPPQAKKARSTSPATEYKHIEVSNGKLSLIVGGDSKETSPPLTKKACLESVKRVDSPSPVTVHQQTIAPSTLSKNQPATLSPMNTNQSASTPSPNSVDHQSPSQNLHFPSSLNVDHQTSSHSPPNLDQSTSTLHTRGNVTDIDLGVPSDKAELVRAKTLSNGLEGTGIDVSALDSSNDSVDVQKSTPGVDGEEAMDTEIRTTSKDTVRNTLPNEASFSAETRTSPKRSIDLSESIPPAKDLDPSTISLASHNSQERSTCSSVCSESSNKDAVPSKTDIIKKDKPESQPQNEDNALLSVSCGARETGIVKLDKHEEDNDEAIDVDTSVPGAHLLEPQVSIIDVERDGPAIDVQSGITHTDSVTMEVDHADQTPPHTSSHYKQANATCTTSITNVDLAQIRGTVSTVSISPTDSPVCSDQKSPCTCTTESSPTERAVSANANCSPSDRSNISPSSSNTTLEPPLPMDVIPSSAMSTTAEVNTLTNPHITATVTTTPSTSLSATTSEATSTISHTTTTSSESPSHIPSTDTEGSSPKQSPPSLSTSTPVTSLYTSVTSPKITSSTQAPVSEVQMSTSALSQGSPSSANLDSATDAQALISDATQPSVSTYSSQLSLSNDNMKSDVHTQPCVGDFHSLSASEHSPCTDSTETTTHRSDTVSPPSTTSLDASSEHSPSIKLSSTGTPDKVSTTPVSNTSPETMSHSDTSASLSSPLATPEAPLPSTTTAPTSDVAPLNEQQSPGGLNARARSEECTLSLAASNEHSVRSKSAECALRPGLTTSVNAGSKSEACSSTIDVNIRSKSVECTSTSATSTSDKTRSKSAECPSTVTSLSTKHTIAKSTDQSGLFLPQALLSTPPPDSPRSSHTVSTPGVSRDQSPVSSNSSMEHSRESSGAKSVDSTLKETSVVPTQMGPTVTTLTNSQLKMLATLARKNLVRSVTANSPSDPSIKSTTNLNISTSQTLLSDSTTKANAIPSTNNASLTTSVVSSGQANTSDSRERLSAKTCEIDGKTRPVCMWCGCASVRLNWEELFSHIVYDHLPSLPKHAIGCLWVGCTSIAKRQRPSLLYHIQTHHCTPDSPPALPNVTKILLRIKHVHQMKDEECVESLLTKSVHLTAALVIRNMLRALPEARQRLLPYEPQLSEVACSNSEASTAAAECLYLLHNAE